MVKKEVIYNVTVKVDKDTIEDWKHWMRDKHIPDVMATGCFLSSQMNKVLFVDDDEGEMYTIQYVCDNMAQLQKYQGSYAPKLQKEHQERYNEKCVAFRSVMEVQEKFKK